MSLLILAGRTNASDLRLGFVDRFSNFVYVIIPEAIRTLFIPILDNPIVAVVANLNKISLKRGYLRCTNNYKGGILFPLA
jgi:hypothetical protein